MSACWQRRYDRPITSSPIIIGTNPVQTIRLTRKDSTVLNWDAIVKNAAVTPPPPKCVLSTKVYADNLLGFLNIDEEEIARQLCLMDHGNFSLIRVRIIINNSAELCTTHATPAPRASRTGLGARRGVDVCAQRAGSHQPLQPAEPSVCTYDRSPGDAQGPRTDGDQVDCGDAGVFAILHAHHGH